MNYYEVLKPGKLLESLFVGELTIIIIEHKVLILNDLYVYIINTYAINCYKQLFAI